MADVSFTLWAKYWPAGARTRAKIEQAIDAVVARAGATRGTVVDIVPAALPDRLVITVRDVSRALTITHNDIVDELTEDGARR